MGAVNNLNQGDVAEIWRAIRQLQVATPLNSASIGSGGMRVYDGGVITIQNGGLSVTGTATILGTLIASGIINFTGTVTISGPLTVSGLTTVTNSLVVAAGGKITAGTIELNPDGSAKFGTMTISPAGKITSGSAEINADGSVKFGTFLIDTAGKVTLANDLTVTSAGKIIAGGVTIDPTYFSGAVKFTNGSYVAATPNGAQMVQGSGGLGVSTTQAFLSFIGGGSAIATSTGLTLTMGSQSVAVTSSGTTVTGNATVTGNLNANSAIMNAGMPTTTIAANMYASGSNTFYKVTSAARFKVDPQPMNLPDSLLGVRVKDWLDRGEVERGEAVRRVPGVIAEEVEAAGGAAFVAYGDDGEIQGVAYDRYALARTEILARRLDEAEARIKELEDAA
jgi:hypothetical protein